eukprot:gene1031-14084_t
MRMLPIALLDLNPHITREMVVATLCNVVYADALNRPHFAGEDLDEGRGLDALRHQCARAWEVWRNDVPSVPGAPERLRRNDRVRTKSDVSLNAGAVIVAAGREGVVTRGPRDGRVRVRVGDREWSEDEAEDVLELLGGQRPFSAALP